jgi:hypothetical protein
VLAPGPADQPLRYIDARDLASWLLGAVEGNVSGPVNLVNPPDHATMRTLLEAAVTVTESAATSSPASFGPMSTGLVRRACVAGLLSRLLRTLGHGWKNQGV